MNTVNGATVRNLLVRGMLAGLAAGVLAFVVAYLLGEPRVDAAIAYEESHSHEHEMEIVSRTLQSTAGLATGVLVYGVALGGIAALAFCFALGRIGRFGPRATALLLAGAALVAVYLVPFLKYPANPPSVGDPDTIGKRTLLYFLMMLLGVLLAVAAVILGKRLARGWAPGTPPWPPVPSSSWPSGSRTPSCRPSTRCRATSPRRCSGSTAWPPWPSSSPCGPPSAWSSANSRTGSFSPGPPASPASSEPPSAACRRSPPAASRRPR